MPEIPPTPPLILNRTVSRKAVVCVARPLGRGAAAGAVPRVDTDVVHEGDVVRAGDADGPDCVGVVSRVADVAVADQHVFMRAVDVHAIGPSTLTDDSRGGGRVAYTVSHIQFRIYSC